MPSPRGRPRGAAVMEIPPALLPDPALLLPFGPRGAALRDGLGAGVRVRLRHLRARDRERARRVHGGACGGLRRGGPLRHARAPARALVRGARARDRRERAGRAVGDPRRDLAPDRDDGRTRGPARRRRGLGRVLLRRGGFRRARAADGPDGRDAPAARAPRRAQRRGGRPPRRHPLRDQHARRRGGDRPYRLPAAAQLGLRATVYVGAAINALVFAAAALLSRVAGPAPEVPPDARALPPLRFHWVL